MGFSFTATAQCDACGQLMSSSDEDCDHEGKPVKTHTFRRMGEGRDSLVGVQTVFDWKWYRLKEKVGEDWRAYQYVGTKQQVNNMLPSWGSVEELPMRAMSLDAPKDVTEYDNE